VGRERENREAQKEARALKKILITGGAGFIGSHLVRELLLDGHEVTVMDNLFTGTKQNLYGLEAEPRFTFVLQDVTEPFWGQFDQIYNLACPASPIHYQRNPDARASGHCNTCHEKVVTR